MVSILELAKRVKKGVVFLNRRIPNWRTVLRRHEDQFDFQDGDHCVLGTLEHYSGRMKLIKAGRDLPGYIFGNAITRLKIDGEEVEFGFDAQGKDENDIDHQHRVLDALWRAEFER